MQKILRSGKLVDDDTVMKVIKSLKSNEKDEIIEKIGINGEESGLILDGIPRTVY